MWMRKGQEKYYMNEKRLGEILNMDQKGYTCTIYKILTRKGYEQYQIWMRKDQRKYYVWMRKGQVKILNMDQKGIDNLK